MLRGSSLKRRSILNRIVFAVAILFPLGAWSVGALGGGASQQGGDPKVSELNVVAVLPMTGAASSLGAYMSNGVKLGTLSAERQYAGKIKINVTVVDSKSAPKDGVNALRYAMLTKKPDGFLVALSSVSNAVKPIVENERSLTIVTTTSMPGLPQGSSSIIRFYPTSESFVDILADHIEKRCQGVSILYVNDDFGYGNQQLMTQRLKERKKTIAFKDSFELLPRDVNSLIAKAASPSPDCIYLTGYGPGYQSIAKAFRETHPSIHLIADVGFSNPTVLEALGALAEGVAFVGLDVDLDKPSSAEAAAFAKEYIANWNARPYHVAAFAHDAIVALAAARMRAPSSDQGVPPLTKKLVVEGSPYTGASGKLTLDANGEIMMKLVLMRRRDGKNEPLN